MKILYVANIRIPTEKAHGLQIMNTCAALTSSGFDVQLVIPTRKNVIKADPFEYYGLNRNFSIKVISVPDVINLGWIGYAIQGIVFGLKLCSYVKVIRPEVVYSRDKGLLLLLSTFFKNLIWESHVGEYGLVTALLLKRIRGIVCISAGLQDFYLTKGITSDKILVAHDGVEMAKFNLLEDKKLFREKLSLPCDKVIVMYTGSVGLYDWKGVDVFLDAGVILGDKFLFVLVGGSTKDIETLKEKYQSADLLFVGQQLHEIIPEYLKAADILVLPNKSGNIISERYTSPMKLFEYMASNRTIIASDLPSIREVLNESNAYLVPPNSPEALSGAVLIAQGNKAEAEKRAGKALTDVEEFSWEKRGEKINSFIQKLYEKRS